MKNESTYIYDISFRKFWHVIIFDTEVDGKYSGIFAGYIYGTVSVKC